MQGFFTKPQQIRWFLVSGVLATLAGVYALFYTSFNPVVIGLFAFGAIVLLAYTYPFKYWGLGELAIFLIWGPIMIGGVYLILALINGRRCQVMYGTWCWQEFLTGWVLPVSILASTSISTMMTKQEVLGHSPFVWANPLRAGWIKSRSLLIYVVIAYLVFVPRYFTPVMLIVFLAFKHALKHDQIA